MATIAELPVGTRCLVDVVAMEQDGLPKFPCGCDRNSKLRQVLRALAEQVLVVLTPLPQADCVNCGMSLQTPPGYYAIAPTGDLFGSSGFQLPAKYLIPLPEETT